MRKKLIKSSKQEIEVNDKLSNMGLKRKQCICETPSVKEYNPHNDEYEEYKWVNGNAIHKSNNKYYLWAEEEVEWGYDVLEIFYCPFCGKKLK